MAREILLQAESERVDSDADAYVDKDGLLLSAPCSYAQLTSPVFDDWRKKLLYPKGSADRKLWEWIFITQALCERGMFGSDKRGLGFAVGREPLPDFFANLKCNIMASDLVGGKSSAQWAASSQHAERLENLYTGYFSTKEDFYQNVSFKSIDMNNIPNDEAGYDFLWSSCALEHVGNMELAEDFIYNAMKCLKPGGVAVHTTEYNLSSNSDTVLSGPSVILRARDFERISENLRKEGHEINLCFKLGESPADEYVALPPYGYGGLLRSMRGITPHLCLRLLIEGYIATSYGLIIKKC
jgi:SAM-dependent methyltransferase